MTSTSPTPPAREITAKADAAHTRAVLRSMERDYKLRIDALVAALVLAREKIDVWIGAMHETIDCSDDVDALEKIDAALRAARGDV